MCTLFYCCARVQLLGELLLDRSNVRLMMRYVSDVKNLMQMMMMLKDSSRSIQFEAFHVFKARASTRGQHLGTGGLITAIEHTIEAACCATCCAPFPQLYKHPTSGFHGALLSPKEHSMRTKA